MTIQRQYSLPNCTLILQGMGDVFQFQQTDVRPLMPGLVRMECQLAGLENPLSGGREFLESLVAAVSLYTQSLLSHVQSARSGAIAHAIVAITAKHPLVRLEKISDHHHQLMIQPPADASGIDLVNHPPAQTIDLTTVQLFDLVEAIDQFLADTQTLPNLVLKPFETLNPLPRRVIRAAEPIAQQVIPAAIGVSGLAVAAIALFLLPMPKVQEPADLKPQPTATTAAAPSPSASAAPSPLPSASASPQSPASPNLAKLETILTTAPEITDATEVATLRQQLYDRLEQAWKNRTAFPQDLVFRVGVGKDGAIVGYKSINDAAATYARQTPLFDLLSLPIPDSRPEADPIAQYKVVFTASGILEVAPWQQVMASPLTPTGGAEITDTPRLEALLTKVRQQINANWQEGQTSYAEDLIFRVRVKEDGAIADYKPDNPAAYDHIQETPLPKIAKPADESGGALTEPHAVFKVVFTPKGSLEISPWRGWKD